MNLTLENTLIPSSYQLTGIIYFEVFAEWLLEYKILLMKNAVQYAEENELGM